MAEDANKAPVRPICLVPMLGQSRFIYAEFIETTRTFAQLAEEHELKLTTQAGRIVSEGHLFTFQ